MCQILCCFWMYSFISATQQPYAGVALTSILQIRIPRVREVEWFSKVNRWKTRNSNTSYLSSLLTMWPSWKKRHLLYGPTRWQRGKMGADMLWGVWSLIKYRALPEEQLVGRNASKRANFPLSFWCFYKSVHSSVSGTEGGGQHIAQAFSLNQ